MPKYSYSCNSCENEGTIRLKVSKRDEQFDCPSCGTLITRSSGCDYPVEGFTSYDPALKGRAKLYKESIKLDIAATKHKSGSAKWKELKNEKKKLEKAHSNETSAHDKEIAYTSKRDKGDPTR